jgi:hypothetical protein
LYVTGQDVQFPFWLLRECIRMGGR